MKVFVAGASGLVGGLLVPLLVKAGHAVTAMTRTADKATALRETGAEAVVADALDEASIAEAVTRAAPEVVVHQLTAIPQDIDFKTMAAQFEATNRLRTVGTDHLVAACRQAGVKRLVAQSYAPLLYERKGSWVKTEDDPLDPDPPGQIAPIHAAIRHLEAAVTSAPLEGLVLRYGAFYGPGTSIAPGGGVLEAVRRRKLPLVGKGTGVWSFVHLDDVADATLKAVEGGPPGIYNVTDDEPAPVSEWLPHLAEVLGAPPPRWVPAWAARFAVGVHGVAYMTEIRGSSNAKAKRLLGWTPTWPTWREGFRTLA